MTRLFLRFYVGVILILLAASLLQTWLSGERLEPNTEKFFRDVYFGGIRIARQKYIFGQQLERRGDAGAEQRLLNEIKEQYNFPVRIHDVDPDLRFEPKPDEIIPQSVGENPLGGRIRVCSGPDYDLGKGTFIMARIRAGESPVLLFGPLPVLEGPTAPKILLVLGAVLALTAVAIALLLRPVVRQFQLVEETAETIADGDLSARIDQGRGLASSKLVRAFNNMVGQTENMVRSKEELLQSVSHELRTPLSRIHFAADLLRTAEPEKRESKIQALESATDDLDKLVGELLTYARADNPLTEAPATIDVSDVVETAFRKHQLLFPDIEFRTIVPQNTSLIADVNGFERVINNLVANAARFANELVQVETSSSNAGLIINVDDDGPGIPTQERDRAFDPFVRLGETKTGVGLGLAIVRRIVQQNGGSAEITDSATGGCRITTTWPTRQPREGEAPAEPDVTK